MANLPAQMDDRMMFDAQDGDDASGAAPKADGQEYTDDLHEILDEDGIDAADSSLDIDTRSSDEEVQVLTPARDVRA